MQVAPASLLLVLLLPLTTSAPEPRYAGSWSAALTVSRTGSFEHAGETYASSSSLAVRWLPPLQPIAFYVLVALEQRGVLEAETSAEETQYLFEYAARRNRCAVHRLGCTGESVTAVPMSDEVFRTFIL